jgi:hypothetical protein
MPSPLSVQVEIGPKGKKVAAVARDWPGLSRGGATEEKALATLLAYVPRYAAVAKVAGIPFEAESLEVVDRYPGTGSTDFWGISFAFSEFDKQPVTDRDLERELSLMEACWSVFDDVHARVSAELKKGPRGGGRDRDRIVHHVMANEHEWTPREAGVKPGDEIPLAGEALRAHRDGYTTAIRKLHAEGRMAGRWPLRYLIRHTAFHTMDHAWEMEDKDLTGD